MFTRLKVIAGVLAIFAVVAWGTRTIVRYFSYQTPPKIMLQGLAPHGYCNKTSKLTLLSDNGYKISDLAVFIDGKAIDLGRAQWISSRHMEVPLVIDTTTMTNGPHVLEAELADASYKRNKTRSKWVFVVDNVPLRASFFEPESVKVFQGKTLHIKIQANKQLENAKLTFLNKTHTCTPTEDGSTLYECFIPIACETTPQNATITAQLEDHVKNTQTLSCPAQILEFVFTKQKGYAIGSEKMSEKFSAERQISMSSNVLQEATNRWIKESPAKKLWSGPFDYPVEVLRCSTQFGEVRTTPERGKYHHLGVDLINQPKCIVWASQTGKIIIKDRFEFTGNTVVIDHGLGVFTLYGHLESFADVNVGNMVKRGAPIGKLGMTGYATGYHLHWEVRVNNIPVDPLEWTNRVY